MSPILEHGSNFPRSLGFKNYPATKTRPLRQSIATMGAAIGGERDRTLLPQGLPMRGTGLLTGRARSTRGRGRPLSESERLRRHKGLNVNIDDDVRFQNQIFSRQLTSRPIAPMFDRPKPIIDLLKSRSTLIPRRKAGGAFGLVGQRSRGSRRMTLPMARNIPTPWKTRKWPATANVARLPSAVGILSGPSNTQYPLRALSVHV